MKTKKYILLFLFIAFCFTDCRKYPEGPTISMRTKKQRITGTYDVEQFLVNGADSTDSLGRDSFNPIYPRHYTFGPTSKDDKNRDNYIGSDLAEGGKWGFNNKKKYLLIQFDALPSHSPFLTAGTIFWEIQRLTNEQMWLQTTYNSKEYYTKFTKIQDK